MGKVSGRLKFFIKYDPNRRWSNSIREFERQIGWKNCTRPHHTENDRNLRRGLPGELSQETG